MVNHLYSIGILSIVAVAYILLFSVPTRLSKETTKTLGYFCWILVGLKFGDINIMLLFHLAQIPPSELVTSFNLLMFCNLVSMLIIFWVDYTQTWERDRIYRVMWMQGLLLFQLAVAGSLVL